MIAGVGVDLLHLPRLRALIARRGAALLARRILSVPEFAEWNERQLVNEQEKGERYLALRWTAKEAAYKALYPIYKATWKDLQIWKEEGSKPVLAFSPTASLSSEEAPDGRLLQDQLNMHLSISHDADLMIAYVCIVPACDICLAIFMGFYDFGTPSYVYLTALAVSLIEGRYIAIAVTLIELHKFTHSHWDMGKVLLPLWCASLTINLAYCIGGSSSDSTDSTFEIGAIANWGSLANFLIVMSFLLHILLLTDPKPNAHGFHPKHRYHQFRDNHRRRHLTDMALLTLETGRQEGKREVQMTRKTTGLQEMRTITRSGEVLPPFAEPPAIIGATFCGLTGIAAVVGWYMLHEGAVYHNKSENVGRDPATLKHQRNPIFILRYFLLAVALAMFITEWRLPLQHSYLYMLSFLLVDNDSDYCVTFSPETSKKACSNSAATMGCLIVGLLLLAVPAWTYEHVVTEAVSWFDYRKEQHAYNYRRNGGQPLPSAAAGRRGSAPPAYGFDDEDRGEDDDDQYNDGKRAGGAYDDYAGGGDGAGYGGGDSYRGYEDRRGGAR
ncbi:hypothetical protein JCM1841_001091 [Sporobolomyces salmonicolor]